MGIIRSNKWALPAACGITQHPHVADKGDNTGAKTEFISCEFPLSLAQGMLSKCTQGNYGSSLCIWRSQNWSIELCGGPNACPLYERRLLSQLAGSRQSLPWVIFAPMISQSPYPGLSCPLVGEKGNSRRWESYASSCYYAIEADICGSSFKLDSLVVCSTSYTHRKRLESN